jgi:hypothetical protein
LLYGGNICPTEPTPIENFVNGFTSYFRAYMRLLRDGWRRIGFAGQCEQDFAQLEGEALSRLINEFWNNPDFREEIYNQLVEKADDKKAALSGRVIANILVTLSAGAAIGDVRYYIEVSVKATQQIDTGKLIEMVVSGEADDFVKYFDVDCACKN